MSKLAIKLKQVGLSKDDPDSDFDRVQLDIGTKIELEHTGDKEAAKEIAKDHLVEDENYYKKLVKIEAKKMKKAVMLAKAKSFPIGTIRKFGSSFYKKAPNKKWVRVPTKQGRATFEKQESKGKIGIKKPVAVKGKQSWKMTWKELPVVYHGGKSKIVGDIDLTKVQQRDYGFYGKGFYATTSKEHAKAFGRSITEKYISSEAKILRASLKPKDALNGLVDAVTKEYYAIAYPKAKERGKLNLLKQEINSIRTEPLAWKNAVDRYAERNKYDIIKYAEGEVVVKNTEVLKDYSNLQKKTKIGVKRKKPGVTKKPVKSGTKSKKTASQIDAKQKTGSNTYQKKRTLVVKKEIGKKPVVLKTKTQQYVDKLKKISIMSREGKKNYYKMIKQAIADKDRQTLDAIFKDIDNWLLRNKKFKAQKNIRTTR